MRVEFFGTAGFHPNAERHTAGIYLPEAAPNHAFLLDAGTGTWRLTTRQLPPHLHIFLTHAHLDHITGLTYLLDVSALQSTQILIYGDAKTLEAARGALFGSPLFPLEMSYATREITPQKAFEVAGVQINTHPLIHPGGCLAYRLDWPGKRLAYVTDTQSDDSYFPFISGADLLIHERNFPDRLDELARKSGHSTSSDLVRAARSSGAKRVAAIHFNPLTTGDPLVEDDVYGQLPGVIGARDEMVIEF